MYRIDRNANEIHALKLCSFGELGFQERKHLQEWIAKQPSALGEELLIIEKEFSGFSDTNERLDLLALDKQGSLVIIENKLDDTGRDVTWQALKYASYCSGFSKDDIKSVFQNYLNRTSTGKSAEQDICDFLGCEDFEDANLNKGVTQRIILIAAHFRKEVTSTVLWLMNFNVRLQCFTVVPYAMGDELFLSVDQIIPTKGTEDFMIGLAKKAQEDVADASSEKLRESILKSFWICLLDKLKGTGSPFSNISPQPSNWISASSGIPGIVLVFSVTKKFSSVKIYIDINDKEKNKTIFDRLTMKKDILESSFGLPLEWRRLDDKRASVIKHEFPLSLYEGDNREQLASELIERMDKLVAALRLAFP